MCHEPSRTPVPTILDYPNILMRTLVRVAFLYHHIALTPKSEPTVLTARLAATADRRCDQAEDQCRHRPPRCSGKSTRKGADKAARIHRLTHALVDQISKARKRRGSTCPQIGRASCRERV